MVNYLFRKPQHLLILIISVLFFLTLAGCGKSSEGDKGKAVANKEGAGGKTLNLVLASSAPSDLSMGKTLKFFAEQVEKKTNGQVKFKVFLDGSLYSEATAVQALKNHEVDVCTISDGNFGAFSKKMFFMNLPYVFNSRESFAKVLQSPLMEQIKKEIEQEGYKPIAFLENGGMRVFYNRKHPVRVPADTKDLKIRTVDSPVDVSITESFGASATPVAWAETYNALAQGVVDGAHAPWDWALRSRHVEVCKYATEIDAIIGIHLLLMDPKRFNELPPNVQQAIIESAKEAEKEIIKITGEDIAKCKDEAINKMGVKVYKPTPEELEKWREAGRSVWPKYSKEVPQKLLDDILAIQK